MSHDIPSRARAIIAFLGVETGYWSTNQGAGIHVHPGGRSPAARLSMARLGVYFAPSGYGRSMTLLRAKKPTTAFVFWPRLEIHVGSGPD